MKKVLIGVAVFAVAAGTAAFLYRDQIGMMIAFGRLKPEMTFAEATPPAAPDYTQPQGWAALPDREDAADVVPSSDVQDIQSTAEVDVFFVHPTTFFGTAGWNQSLDDTSTNQLTDMFVLRSQASVFNSCCRIYAPRYRQATIFSFMDCFGQRQGMRCSSRTAMSSARSTTTSSTTTRAGRSSSRVTARVRCTARTLLEKRITGTPLRERLVAAYPIGFSIDREAMAKAVPDVPVCESAEQIGCVVSWNAVGPEAAPWGDPRKNICVNPLTWRTDGAAAEASMNLGGVAYPGTFEGTLADVKGVPQEFVDAKPVLEPGVADAQCVDGMLRIQEIHSQNYAARPMGTDNYHIYDYNLFHMNLQEERRAAGGDVSRSSRARQRRTDERVGQA